MRYPTLAAPSFLRPVAIFAGVASLVQATVNIVLSILGILVYECQLTVSEDSSNIERCFVVTYFQGPKCQPASGRLTVDGLLTPDTVFAWVIAFLVVNAVWFITSSVVIHLAVKFKRKTVLPCLYVWTLYTLGVCCMDLASTIYFALQSQVLTFAQIEGSTGNTTNAFPIMAQRCGGAETLLSVPVILMSMTARYYIFWLMNAALVTVIGVSALGISYRNSHDQDFFDDNFSTQHIFGSGDSFNSLNNESRRDLSIIDGWKEPWQSIPVVKIPKARSMASAPSLYSVPDSHFSAAELSPGYPQSHLAPTDAYAEDTVSRASSSLPPAPIPPPPPPPQPSTSGAGRHEQQRPTRPKKHPPPPPDQKPLRPALKNSFTSENEPGYSSCSSEVTQSRF